MTEIPPLPTCEICGVELVIGERALPPPRCSAHEAAILVCSTVACGDWVKMETDSIGRQCVVGFRPGDGNDLEDLARLRNELAGIRLALEITDQFPIISAIRGLREQVFEYKAQRDMLMEATGPCVSDHARRLRDLEAKVKELHETLDSHGIYHA